MFDREDYNYLRDVLIALLLKAHPNGVELSDVMILSKPHRTHDIKVNRDVRANSIIIYAVRS